MKVPALLFGTTKLVNANCSKFARAIANGEDFEDAIGKNYIDSSSQSGLFILHGPNPAYAQDQNYHFYMLFQVLLKQFIPGAPPTESMKKWFSYCVKSEWGLLCLIANGLFTATSVQQEIEIANRLCEKWQDIAIAPGNRFAGLQSKKHLWQIPDSSLFTLLHKIGIPKAELTYDKFINLSSESIPLLIERYMYK